MAPNAESLPYRLGTTATRGILQHWGIFGPLLGVRSLMQRVSGPIQWDISPSSVDPPLYLHDGPSV